MDSTSELRARNQLDKLKFCYLDIDGHVAEFEDLIVKANYNLASQEAINLFLKGFSHNRNLLDKVFSPPVPKTYENIKQRMIAIVKSMQLVNSIAQNAPTSNPSRGTTNHDSLREINNPHRGMRHDKSTRQTPHHGCVICQSQWTRAIEHVPLDKTSKHEGMQHKLTKPGDVHNTSASTAIRKDISKHSARHPRRNELTQLWTNQRT
jgi:hypothetical protein